MPSFSSRFGKARAAVNGKADSSSVNGNVAISKARITTDNAAPKASPESVHRYAHATNTEARPSISAAASERPCIAAKMSAPE